VSFILDALRKSEHERQRSAVPGLSQVPLATPQPQLPRWALGVMAVLGAALLVVGGAWWQSTRSPAQVAATEPTVERSVELPPPSFTRAAPQQTAPSRPAPQAPSNGPSLASAAAPIPADGETFAPATGPAPRALNLPEDAAALRAPSPPPQAVPSVASPNLQSAPASMSSTPSVNLPSAASLAAEGVAVPALHLELHAYSERPRDRFVFINGRKYVEGDRLPEGPQLVAIEPAGAVLTHAGRRFLLVQD